LNTTHKPLFQTGVAGEYPDFLRDESRRSGRADTISFARSEEDICEVLRACLPVTTQGARTGITGGAVPDGGHILNLSRMAGVTGLRAAPDGTEFFVTVQPGLPLCELRKMIQNRAFDTADWSKESLQALALFRESGLYFFPPDPTETSASVGGMVACNASGACTFRYGATRQYVEALRVVLMGGEVISLRRGREKAKGRSYSVRTESGRVIEGTLPGYAMPSVKNASGFFAEENMDLVDLFVGSEGTLGVFSSIELRLIPRPACCVGVMAFFPSDDSAVGFVKTIRGLPSDRRPVAMEYFDGHALDLLRREKAGNSSVEGIPALPETTHTAVYLEYHGEEDSVMDVVGDVPEWMAGVGGDAAASWIADSDSKLERFKLLRHAVPEAVNRVIDERRKQEPGLSKLGTDMAVPDRDLSTVLEMYRAGLNRTGLEFVIFGHIGNNHVHVNILPRSLEDYNRGKDLYLEWARRVIALGGTVSAEHGIGKFKVVLLREMLGEEGIRQMRDVKRVFDPSGLLNQGNLFA